MASLSLGSFKPWAQMLLVHFAVLLALFVGMRTAAVLLSSAAVEPALALAGLWGDLLAAAAAAALLLAVHGTRRWIAGVCLTALLLLTIANLEHIYALDDALRLEQAQFATDLGLILGTIAGIRSWPFALATAIMIFALWRLARLPQQPGPAYRLAAIGLLAVTSILLWQNARQAFSWRQTNPLALMVVNFAGDDSSGSTTAAQSSPLETAQVQRFFARELDEGVRLPEVAAQRAPRPNILFIMLEGIPGAYLTQVQQATGFKSAITMPGLSQFAEQALSVPNFMIHSFGTIGGTYALLCGDYSNQTQSFVKAYHFLRLKPSDRFACLPQVLADAGYQTSYLQAADLGIMSKSDFMPAIGFAESAQAAVADAAQNSSWGANDSALFAATRDAIEKLEKGDRPWMLTLLNTGTHYPFSAPDAYNERYATRKEAAVAFLDDSLAAFFSDLEQSGTLDDTLVLIASDESHGVPGHEFSNEWGTFLVAGPGIEPGINPGPFAQLDTMLTLLDYLDLAADHEHAIGRSMLRSYSEPRQLMFGEFISTSPGEAITCNADLCRSIATGTGQLLGTSYQHTLMPDSQSASVKKLYRDARRATQLFHGRETTQNLLFAVYDEPLKGRERAGISRAVQLRRGDYSSIVLALTNNGANAVDLLWIWSNDKGERYFDQFQPRLGSLSPGARLSLRVGTVNTHQDGDWHLTLLAVANGGLVDVTIDKLEVTATATELARNKSNHAEGGSQIPASLADDWKFPDGSPIFVNAAFPLNTEDHKEIRSDYVLTDRGLLPVARYQLGDKISLAENGPWYGNLYLGYDWSYPEKWGVWSDGEKPALVFYLDDIDDAVAHQLVLSFLPFVKPPKYSEQRITFAVNGTVLGSRTYTESAVEQGSFEIPSGVLKPNGLNTVTFEVGSPYVPADINPEADSTVLGIGLIEFSLQTTPAT